MAPGPPWLLGLRACGLSPFCSQHGPNEEEPISFSLRRWRRLSCAGRNGKLRETHPVVIAAPQSFQHPHADKLGLPRCRRFAAGVCLSACLSVARLSRASDIPTSPSLWGPPRPSCGNIHPLQPGKATVGGLCPRGQRRRRNWSSGNAGLNSFAFGLDWVPLPSCLVQRVVPRCPSTRPAREPRHRVGVADWRNTLVPPARPYFEKNRPRMHTPSGARRKEQGPPPPPASEAHQTVPYADATPTQRNGGHALRPSRLPPTGMVEPPRSFFNLVRPLAGAGPCRFSGGGGYVRGETNSDPLPR